MALVSCKECNKEIGSTAKSCPHCGTDQRGWFSKHPILGTIIILILSPFLLAIFVGFYEGFTGNKISETQTNSNNKENIQKEEKNIVSYNFSDFSIACDMNATGLQKKDEFERKFKNRYVMWTGEVSSIDTTLGIYMLHVKHCSGTFTSDITISMREDQKDKLLNYRAGQSISYVTKLVDYGEILGISGDDGEVK